MEKRQLLSIISVLAVVGVGGALWMTHILPPSSSQAHLGAGYYGNPDIMITGAIPEQVEMGAPMYLTYTARNVGDGIAQQTYVLVHIPGNALYDRGHSDPECVLKGSDVICGDYLGGRGFELVPGEARTFTVAISVDSLACSQVIENSASAEVLWPEDQNLTNNSMKAMTSVECGSSTRSPFPVNSKGQWQWVQGQGWVFLLPYPSTYTRFDNWFWNTPAPRPSAHTERVQQYFPQYSAADSNRWTRQ